MDHCLGRLFEALRNLGYYDDSVIFLLADHGHPLNDHGKFLKARTGCTTNCLRCRSWSGCRKGNMGGRRTSAIVQYQDVLPTLLDALGLPGNTDAMAGRSFMPVLTGDADEHRRSMITGYHGGIDRCTRDETWSYIQRPAGEPDELLPSSGRPEGRKQPYRRSARRGSAPGGRVRKGIQARVLERGQRGTGGI